MELRKIEVLRENKWKTVRLKDIKIGEKFRMFESTGEPVKNLNDDVEFVAASDPFLSNNGPDGIEVMTIETELDLTKE